MQWMALESWKERKEYIMNDMLVLKWKKDKAPLPQGVFLDAKGDY